MLIQHFLLPNPHKLPRVLKTPGWFLKMRFSAGGSQFYAGKGLDAWRKKFILKSCTTWDVNKKNVYDKINYLSTGAGFLPWDVLKAGIGISFKNTYPYQAGVAAKLLCGIRILFKNPCMSEKVICTWKAKCPIFKSIVAGFRGKVA